MRLLKIISVLLLGLLFRSCVEENEKYYETNLVTYEEYIQNDAQLRLSNMRLNMLIKQQDSLIIELGKRVQDAEKIRQERSASFSTIKNRRK